MFLKISQWTIRKQVKSIMLGTDGQNFKDESLLRWKYEAILFVTCPPRYECTRISVAYGHVTCIMLYRYLIRVSCSGRLNCLPYISLFCQFTDEPFVTKWLNLIHCIGSDLRRTIFTRKRRGFQEEIWGICKPPEISENNKAEYMLKYSLILMLNINLLFSNF